MSPKQPNFKYPHIVDFVRAMLTKDIEPWQLEAMEIYDEFGCSGKSARLAVAAGHGVGKSALCSWILMHSLLRYGNEISGVVTANTGNQLIGKLVREINYWVRVAKIQRHISVTAHKMTFRATGQHSFVTWRKERPEAFAGLHAKYVVVIYDEASSIPDDIWVVSEGATTGHSYFWLCTGNPTRSSGYFHSLFHSKMGEGWEKLTVSAADLTTQILKGSGYAEDIAKKFGIGSDIYRVRVLGQFPHKGISSSLFTPLELANIKAVGTQVECSKLPVILGVDVARYGECSSVIARRVGSSVTFEIFNALPLTQLALIIVGLVTEDATRGNSIIINVDGTGVGGGVVDILMEKLRNTKHPIQLNELQFSAQTQFVGGVRLLNNRITFYYKLKQYLQCNQLEIPENFIMDIVGFLSKLQIEYTNSDALLLSKKSLLGGGVAVDIADAIALTFAD